MKLSLLNYSISQFAILGRLSAAVALATLAACSTFTEIQREGDSSLPIQTVNTGSGVVSSPRAYKTADQLYITGSLSQTFGQPIPAPAHIDVQLFAADGSVVAEERDNIDPSHPRLSRARHRRVPFVVSFPLAEVGNAVRIVIRYHPAIHSARATVNP